MACTVASPGMQDGVDCRLATFDIIIDTIPVKHDVSSHVGLLDVEGVLVIVGNVGAWRGLTRCP